MYSKAQKVRNDYKGNIRFQVWQISSSDNLPYKLMMNFVSQDNLGVNPEK